MGQSISNHTPITTRGPHRPDYENTSNVDPQYGFQFERKTRALPVSEAELISAKVPHQYRDFCAHLFINYKACKKDHFPFYYRCAPAKHEYFECQFEDQVIRMKEYERERRLRERQLRKERREAIKEERRRMVEGHHTMSGDETLHD